VSSRAVGFEAGDGEGAAPHLASLLAPVLKRLHLESGFPPHAVDAARLASHLRARATALGISRPDDTEARAVAAMLRHLEGDREEFTRLEAVFSPPETWLFRYPESFEFARDFAAARAGRALHEVSQRPTPSLRALIVGAGGWCEPCSLAASLLEGVRRASSALPIEIEATDRSPEVFAQPPRFRDMQRRGAIPEWAAPYFEREGDAIRATDATRAPIATRVADETRVHADAAVAGRPWDLVLFRNVAIYLEESRRARAYRALASMLAPGGALLVGHSEVHLAAQATGLAPAAHASSFALVAVDAARVRPTPVERSSTRGVPAREASGGAEPPRTTQPASRGTPAAAPPTRPDSASSASAASSGTLPASAAQPSADAFVAQARELAGQGDPRGAEQAVSRALYLDLRHEPALLLAAELAERRGAGVEAQRFRDRALRAHLAREEADEHPPRGDATPP
jgi:chemotaxis protein methyltransferase WspC